MDSIEEARAREHAKYDRSYESKRYAMGAKRMADAIGDLKALPCRGSYLDVSCGRGEMLKHAADMGFDPTSGTEIVEALLGPKVLRAEVHDLPFESSSVDVVTMFDVIEHLIPGDDKLATEELGRVARHHILISANNRPSHNKAGDDLHINKRPYPQWDELFREWLPGTVVTWIRGPHRYVSETWRIDL